jgi:hypothetical protein
MWDISVEKGGFQNIQQQLVSFKVLGTLTNLGSNTFNTKQCERYQDNSWNNPPLEISY